MSRLVLPVTLSRRVRAAAQTLMPDAVVVDVAWVGEPAVIERRPGDVLVHGFPDVFGRVVSPPPDADLLICEAVARPFLAISRSRTVEVVGSTAVDSVAVASELRRLHGILRHRRGVHPVFDEPPLLGLPYLAPGGMTLPGDFGVVEDVSFPGLPDLVVVRAAGRPRPGGGRIAFEPVVVA